MTKISYNHGAAFACTVSRLRSPKLLHLPQLRLLPIPVLTRKMLSEKADDPPMIQNTFLTSLALQHKRTYKAQNGKCLRVPLGVLKLQCCLSRNSTLEIFLAMHNLLSFKGHKHMGEKQPMALIEAPTMRPPRASTSRTRVPFARPPMLGLQLISPTLAAGEGVTSIV